MVQFLIESVVLRCFGGAIGLAPGSFQVTPCVYVASQEIVRQAVLAQVRGRHFENLSTILLSNGFGRRITSPCCEI